MKKYESNLIKYAYLASTRENPTTDVNHAKLGSCKVGTMILGKQG